MTYELKATEVLNTLEGLRESEGRVCTCAQCMELVAFYFSNKGKPWAAATVRALLSERDLLVNTLRTMGINTQSLLKNSLPNLPEPSTSP